MSMNYRMYSFWISHYITYSTVQNRSDDEMPETLLGSATINLPSHSKATPWIVIWCCVDNDDDDNTSTDDHDIIKWYVK